MLTKIQNAARLTCTENLNGLTCKTFECRMYVPAKLRKTTFSGFSVREGRSVTFYSRSTGTHGCAGWIIEQADYCDGWVSYLRSEYSA